jgi:hypothetical protein
LSPGWSRRTLEKQGLDAKMDETIYRLSHLSSTRVHCTGKIRDYPALASIIDSSIHLCRYPATPCALVPCIPSPNHFLTAASPPSLFPLTPLQYPFTLPTPFLSLHTCTPPPRRRSHSRRSQHFSRQHLNPKLPQLRQGLRWRRDYDKSRSTCWLDGSNLDYLQEGHL